MSDYLATCNTGDLRTDAKSFQDVWCARCSQVKCDLAKDPMSRRQATWREHYFGMPSADLGIPKYAQIAGLNFQDLLEKAVKMEISSQRGDWSVPDVTSANGRITEKTTTQLVEEAVQQYGQPSEPEEDLIEEEDLSEAQDDEDPPVPFTPPPRKGPVVLPRAGNTPDRGEVMLGGLPSASDRKPPLAERDPWAPPVKSTVRVVQIGATIVLGGSKKVDDD